MICSEARLNANRTNAQRSTGPRTPDGKARASQNALKHGLCAAGASVLPTEDPDAYASFTAALAESLRPRTPLERDLALRIADLTWRLRRIPDAEAAILARDVQHRIDHARTQYDRALAQHEDYCRHRPTKKHLPDPPQPPDLTPVPAACSLAATFCGADDARNPFLNLQRYEQSLDRARSRALKELRQLQKDRRDHPEEHEAPPRRNEPTSHTEDATPSLLEGAAWGERECSEDQDAREPRRNEPTIPRQGTSDQGPMTPTEELRNEPNAQSPNTCGVITQSDHAADSPTLLSTDTSISPHRTSSPHSPDPAECPAHPRPH